MSSSSATQAAGRRTYLDWLRGLAVLIMIEAHTINAWTAIADQSGSAYGWAMIVGGFGAPGFLFLAGIGVVLSATARTTKTGSARAAGSLVARRGWEIFGLAFLFRLQSYLLNPGAPVASLLKVDILNIMGPSMAAAAWLWALPRRDPGRSFALIVATVTVGSLTPFVRELSVLNALPDPLESYLRPLPGRANFVFFPWAAFLFGGAVAGLVLAAVGPAGELVKNPPQSTQRTRRTLSKNLDVSAISAASAVYFTGSRAGHHDGSPAEAGRHGANGRERQAVIGLGAAGFVLALGSYAGSYLPSVFAQSSFWTSSPAFFFLRLGILLLWLPLAFFAPRMLPLERFGRSSLFVYWVHVELVYGIATMPLHRRLGIGWAFLAFAAFTLGMYGLVVVKERIRTPPYRSSSPRAPDRGNRPSGSRAARCRRERNRSAAGG